MASTLVLKLLNEVAVERVTEYLMRRGMPAEIIRWKYYDSHFRHEHPRGCVCVRDDAVVGFLGLLPFHDINGRIDEAAWCCDWSVDPSQAGGVGIMLIKKAQSLYRSLFAIEGSETTRELFPRLATYTLPKAAMRMQLNLRLGAYIEKASKRWPRLANWAPHLGQVPLQSVIRTSSDSRFCVGPGVSPAIGALMEELGKSLWLPVYSLDYLQWQLDRCPMVRCNTCHFFSGSRCEAAILYWRSTFNKFWRIAIWSVKSAWAMVPQMLLKVISEIQKARGMHVSVVVSHTDSALIQIVKQYGFSQWADDIPFYALISPRASPVPTLNHLSYLDCDLAYRF